jgi:hypothetical protein
VNTIVQTRVNDDSLTEVGTTEVIFRSEGLQSVTVEITWSKGKVITTICRDALVKALRDADEKQDSLVVVPTTEDQGWLRVSRREVEDFMAISKNAFSLPY